MLRDLVSTIRLAALVLGPVFTLTAQLDAKTLSDAPSNPRTSEAQIDSGGRTGSMIFQWDPAVTRDKKPYPAYQLLSIVSCKATTLDPGASLSKPGNAGNFTKTEPPYRVKLTCTCGKYSPGVRTWVEHVGVSAEVKAPEIYPCGKK